jgi:anti-sigma regulatory factor (Ser/Thr protein kinase)
VSPGPVDSIGARVLTLRLPPEARSATRARAVTREHLATICPPRAVESAALVVTELVSNAVRHAETEMLLVLNVAPGHIDVRVQDASPALPERREAGPESLSGRGLAIVDELASAWGVEERDGTKIVWATIAIEHDGERDVATDGVSSANGEMTSDSGDLEHLAHIRRR